MDHFVTRPSDRYIFEAEWQELFVLTEHWKSDLLFYRDDLKFLHDLVSRYVMWLSKAGSIDRVAESETLMLDLERAVDDLIQRVDRHLRHIAELIDDPFAHDSHRFRLEHQQLEYQFANFVKSFRNTRRKVFHITTYLLDSKEIQRRMLR